MIGDPKIPGTPCGARLKNAREDGRTTCVKLVTPSGRCRSHGGASPQAERGRLQRLTQVQAIARAELHAAPFEQVTPEQALEQELARTLRHVAGYEGLLHVDEPLPEGLNRVEVGLRLTAERGHLRLLAADMVKLDVTGRRATLLDGQAAEAVAFVRAFVGALGLDINDPMVAAAIRVAAASTDQRSFTAADHAVARAELTR